MAKRLTPDGAYLASDTPARLLPSGGYSALSSSVGYVLNVTGQTYAITTGTAVVGHNRSVAVTKQDYTAATNNVTLTYTQLATGYSIEVVPQNYSLSTNTVELTYTAANNYVLSVTPSEYGISRKPVELRWSGEQETEQRTGGLLRQVKYVDRLAQLRKELAYLYEDDEEEDVTEAIAAVLETPLPDFSDLTTLITLLKKIQSDATAKKAIAVAEEMKKEIKRKREEEAVMLFL